VPAWVITLSVLAELLTIITDPAMACGRAKTQESNTPTVPPMIPCFVFTRFNLLWFFIFPQWCQ
jgi:hypothetical protein